MSVKRPTSESNVIVRSHFSRNADEYQKVVEGTNRDLYTNLRAEMDRLLKGVVLDIGNGNVFNYDIHRLEKVIAYDLSYDGVANTEKIEYITGDARSLKGVKDGQCDVVVMQFLLHHIVNEDPASTAVSASTCLRECRRVLKPDGTLVITEMLVHPIVEWIEDLAYIPAYRLLRAIKRPMVRFYSKKNLGIKLEQAGFSRVGFKEISLGPWVDPFEALFPGKIKIPRALFPARCHVITASA